MKFSLSICSGEVIPAVLLITMSNSRHSPCTSSRKASPSAALTRDSGEMLTSTKEIPVAADRPVPMAKIASSRTTKRINSELMGEDGASRVPVSVKHMDDLNAHMMQRSADAV